MQLTQQTDFALRMLVHLAAHPASDWVPVGQIADIQGLSTNHLLKIAAALASHGLVETRRGAQGGIRLARPPAAIPIGEVVRRMEPNFALVACMQDPPGPCTLRPVCRLKGKLAQARDAFLAVLDEVTLDQCSDDDDMLRSLVAAPTPGD